jgi:hypothetical protein
LHARFAEEAESIRTADFPVLPVKVKGQLHSRAQREYALIVKALVIKQTAIFLAAGVEAGGW